MKKLTRAQAAETARKFIREVVERNRQYDIRTVNSYLPPGWFLVNAETDDFWPPTVKTLTTFYLNKARSHG